VHQSNSILLFKNLLLASDMIACSIVEDQLHIQHNVSFEDEEHGIGYRRAPFYFVSLHHNIDQSFNMCLARQRNTTIDQIKASIESDATVCC